MIGQGGDLIESFKMIQPGITLLLILAVFSKCLSCFLIIFAFLLVGAVKYHDWVKGEGHISSFFKTKLSNQVGHCAIYLVGNFHVLAQQI